MEVSPLYLSTYVFENETINQGYWGSFDLDLVEIGVFSMYMVCLESVT